MEPFSIDLPCAGAHTECVENQSLNKSFPRLGECVILISAVWPLHCVYTCIQPRKNHGKTSNKCEPFTHFIAHYAVSGCPNSRREPSRGEPEEWRPLMRFHYPLPCALPSSPVSLDGSEYCIVLVSAKCRAWYIDHKLLRKQSHSQGRDREGRVLEQRYFCIRSRCLTTNRPSDCDHRNVDDKRVLPLARLASTARNLSLLVRTDPRLPTPPLPQPDVFNPSADTRLQPQ